MSVALCGSLWFAVCHRTIHWQSLTAGSFPMPRDLDPCRPSSTPYRMLSLDGGIVPLLPEEVGLGNMPEQQIVQYSRLNRIHMLLTLLQQNTLRIWWNHLCAQLSISVGEVFQLQSLRGAHQILTKAPGCSKHHSWNIYKDLQTSYTVFDDRNCGCFVSFIK